MTSRGIEAALFSLFRPLKMAEYTLGALLKSLLDSFQAKFADLIFNDALGE